MRGNNVMGLLFSNMHEESIRELTDRRTMASVPIGGRYRMIDFTLSSMVNSGINRVGVITKRNYQSLMDHLGTGKAWDLSRKRDGLFILPPFGAGGGDFSNRIEILHANMGFLTNCKEEYVLLSDCDAIFNMDFKRVIAEHIKNEADVTLIYRWGRLPKNGDETMVLSLEPDGRIKDLIIDPNGDEEYNYAFNMLLIKRELLIRLVNECSSRNKTNFKRDILQSNVEQLKMFGYEFDHYSHVICSMNDYFEANMELMSSEIRDDLFNAQRPIYTKVRDDMPARYGLGSVVKNSLIANGCVIDGEVENCILFRGVKIDKGAKVKNCVIMQDTVIGANSRLDYVVADKNVEIEENRTLMGYQTYPVYIAKESKV